jgi:polysaccharide biosynthesis transport protein
MPVRRHAAGAKRRSPERLVRSLENDARIAGARVDSLSSNLDQLKRQAASTNGQDVQLRALEREAKSQRDLLEAYLAKYRETTARESLGAIPAEARIISRAVVSNTPYFPKKLPIVLIATLATLFLMIGSIATRELLVGDPYRGPIYGPAAMAEVPAAPAFKLESGVQHERRAPPVMPPLGAPSMTTADPTAGIAAERELVDVAVALRRGDRRRILIAGAERGIDSAPAALALARMLSREARVVVVDLAFSAQKLAAVGGDPGAPGFADLVGGTASFGQIITRDRDSRVHLVPAGRIRDEANAILDSERLRMGIEALTQAYDHVVIDAGAVPDMQVAQMARLASSAVLIASVGRETATAAKDCLVAGGVSDVTVLVDPLQFGADLQPAAA